MNVNPLIINALSPLNIQVWPDYYIPETGDDIAPDEYITFNYADERLTSYADGEPLEEEATIHIHYFTKGDPTEKKKQIRKLLRSAGFTILSSEQYYEGDTRFTHVVVTAWIEGNLEE
jgi:hypothetical protein